MIRTATAITALTVLTVAWLAVALSGVTDTPWLSRALFRPGPVYAGHERFGGACHGCHDPWLGVTDGKCAGCHADLMRFDTHAPVRLIKEWKAAALPSFVSSGCVTCHGEHRREEYPNGYTGPADICVICHSSVNFRHAGFDEGSCLTTSCHTYHYNLTPKEYKTAGGERMNARSIMVEKPPVKERMRAGAQTLKAMRESRFYNGHGIIAAQHLLGPHAGTEATCGRCHTTPTGKQELRPSAGVCRDCHGTQTKRYGAGRHGAHDVLGMPPFQDERRQLGCGGCHDAHSASVERARRLSCLECHHSQHVSNYEKSNHFRYLTDPVLKDKPMKGVDCAGCHMPRLEHMRGATEHNESFTSSSKELMAKMVCVRCHGLKYSLKSLYDPEVVESNFTFSPTKTAPGLDYAYPSTQ